MKPGKTDISSKVLKRCDLGVRGSVLSPRGPAVHPAYNDLADPWLSLASRANVVSVRNEGNVAPTMVIFRCLRCWYKMLWCADVQIKQIVLK